MSIVLYWFSATGNSLAVARDLARELGDAELVPVVQALHGWTRMADKVGVVFPVHAFGPPTIILQFLRELPASPATYIFSVATMGCVPGCTHARVNRILAARGLNHAAGWSIQMPSNYIVAHPVLPQGPQNNLFAQATKRVQEIASTVRQGRRGPREDSIPPAAFALGAVHRVSGLLFKAATRWFSVGGQTAHCGLCARICPVGNIRFVHEQPQWGKNCQHCLACLHWCPQRRIQFGFITRRTGRYHHPGVTAEDLCVCRMAHAGGVGGEKEMRSPPSSCQGIPPANRVAKQD